MMQRRVFSLVVLVLLVCSAGGGVVFAGAVGAGGAAGAWGAKSAGSSLGVGEAKSAAGAPGTQGAESAGPASYAKSAAGALSGSGAGSARVLISDLKTPVNRLAGTWTGALVLGPSRLPLVFIIPDAPGYAGSTMDSPTQGARGIPAGSVTLEGTAVTIPMPAIAGIYVGTISEDGSRIEGVWKQGGMSFPMILERAGSGPSASAAEPVTRATAPAESAASAPASAAVPYSVSEVRFSGATAGVELAGTLVIPDGQGPFPAVVMLTGSGPQDRDETLFGLKPFALLADDLARRGIASLRYDDRGIAASTGDFSLATSLDFASDAAAAATWLMSRPGIDTKRVGLMGHSEGGLIAPFAGMQAPGVSYLILLAGPGLPGATVAATQSRLISRADGVPELQIEESAVLNRALFALATSDLPPAELESRLRETYMEGIASMKSIGEAERSEAMQSASRVASQLSNPWFRMFLALDPAPAFAQAALPVLALNGDLDLQVEADENLAAIAAALSPEVRSRSSFLKLPGLNHLFQKAVTGSPSEYPSLGEPMVSGMRKLVADWILALPH